MVKHGSRETLKDWRYLLSEFLIYGGPTGRTKSELIAKLSNYVEVAQIDAELEAWHLEDKVQKFEVPHPNGKTKSTIWRATIKMVEKEQ